MFSALYQYLKRLSKDRTFQRSALNFAAFFTVVSLFVSLTAQHVIIPKPQPILAAEYSTIPADKMDKVGLEEALRSHSSEVKGLIFFNGLNSVVVLGPGLEHDSIVANADVDEMRKLAVADNLPVTTKNPAYVSAVTDLASGWWWAGVVALVVWLGYLLLARREGGQVSSRVSSAYAGLSGQLSDLLKARNISPIRAWTYLLIALLAVNAAAFGLRLYQDNNVYVLPTEVESAKPVQPWQISRYLETNPEQFQRVTFISELNSAYVLLSDSPRTVPGVPGTVPPLRSRE